MTTEYDAAQAIAAAAVETLAFNLSHDQISSMFRLDELISESISEYVGNLVYSSEITELWGALGWPQPDEMDAEQTLIQNMLAAIEEALRDSDRVATTVELDVNSWALAELEERNFEFSGIDEDDTNELVRLLS